ncbi:hypothetical protein KCU65_g6618, partial [Aureobasidium melanogenum]
MKEPHFTASSQQRGAQTRNQSADGASSHFDFSFCFHTPHQFLNSSSSARLSSSAMSDRADFLAGIAASGCGSQFGIYGDFGTFDGPYPDPSPTRGAYEIFDCDMSGDSYPSGSEDHSHDDAPTLKTSHNRNLGKKTSRRAKKKAERRAGRMFISGERMTKAETRKHRLISSYLGKEVGKDYRKLSTESKQNLLRNSKEAHAELRDSTEEKLKHLQWAASTFTTAALSYYICVFQIDERMQKQLDQPDQKEEPLEEELSEAARIESIPTLSQRDRFLVLMKLADEKKHEDKEAREASNKWSLSQLDEMWGKRFSKFIQAQPYKVQKKKPRDLMTRPLSVVPFNTAERRLVEGLLSLLMRVSESVARRPWPQMPMSWKQALTPEDELTVQAFQKSWKEMKQEDNLLDGLRKRIEKGWPHDFKGSVDRLSVETLINKVRRIDEKILGIPLLPSTDCIQNILKIVDQTYLMESRSPDDTHCTMPAELLEEFNDNLHMNDVYDEWRATNPPDSERLSDFADRVEEEPIEQEPAKNLVYPIERVRSNEIKRIKKESNLRHKEQRAAKAARKREKFAAQARPSRKEAPTAQLKASQARRAQKSQ